MSLTSLFGAMPPPAERIERTFPREAGLDYLMHGMTPKKLLKLYKKAGEAIFILPMIRSAIFVPHFDQMEYAAAYMRGSLHPIDAAVESAAVETTAVNTTITKA